MTVQDPAEGPEAFRRAVARAARRAAAPRDRARGGAGAAAAGALGRGADGGRGRRRADDDAPRSWAPAGSSSCTTPRATRPGTATFRVVTFVRAAVEPDVAGDPMLPSVGWSWLIEALEGTRSAVRLAQRHGHPRRRRSPSAPWRDRRPAAEVEIRASWTALDSRLGPHLEAWGELLATTAGLPPLAPGVVALPRARRSR